ncbi:MAG: oligosaccharide flippase family protein [Bacteroidales bacterium]|nr:oligosaccharide flippase family protein [Bacteroidales bacterium]
MASPIKKLIGQTAVYGLSSIVGRFLNYLLVPLYTSLFVTSEYGIVTELFAYAGFLMVFLTYGMETAYFRFSEKHDNPSKVFSTAVSPILFTSSLFIAVVILFSKSIADTLQYPDNVEYIVWFAFIIGLDSITAIPFAKLRRENKAIKFVTFKFINIGLNIGLNLFFLLLCPILSENNPDSFISGFYSKNIGIGYIFISNLIASSVTLLLFLPDFLKAKLIFSKKLLKQLLFYGFPLLFAGLAGMINEVIDRILLKYLIVIPEGIENAHEYVMSQIGIYGANYKLSVLVILFIQAFRYAAEPFFFSQEKKENAKKVYAAVMKYFVIFGLFIFLSIMLYIDIVKYFISNESYWVGLDIIPILLVANLFLGVVYNLSVWFKLTDKTKYGAYIAGVGALITIGVNTVLIPVFGYLGSAWAHFSCYLAMMIISYFLGRKYYRINYPLKDIFIYVLFAGAIYAGSLFFEFKGSVKYLVNTGFILSFIIFVVLKEKLYLRLLSAKKG